MTNSVKMTALAAFCALGFSACSTTSEPNHQNNSTTAHGHARTVTINAVSANGIGQSIGTLQMFDSAEGLVIQTNLRNLPSGPHGFHVHEKGSCAPAMKDGKMGAALAAGGHYNPTNAKNHGTPLTGHLGDLPALLVAIDGTAKVNVIAPRLKLADVKGRAIMIHAGGDNYADDPKPLGGGGDRIACGVI
ncbi:superoxide dismutase [Acinetobacter sp. NCu2D-2]|uniref:superoxide dismutase family protein n=1 Tax=Acinetobacter sp. NCu2D-2 TaxID=1608473 RepID=UPI0007CD9EF7|nr:superoxide dismutase family protein [Acinetobacter sp. NCu2D-2]ANF82631.1 superoxide dismutase [Acinetobacter sp. NCu2D-2]